MDNDTPVGQRIAYYRHQRELSQAELAQLVGRSASWLQKVEYGERVVENIRVLQLLANVLKVSLWDLMPTLGLPPNGGTPLDAPKGMRELTRVVSVNQPPDREPPTGGQLQGAVAEARRLNAGGFYDALAIVLPSMIEDARVAVAQRDADSWWTLSLLYQVASDFACTFREFPLALLAAERAISAADQADDELLLRMGQCLLASVWLAEGWTDAAASLCSNAVDGLGPDGASSPDMWSICGLLNLNAAVASARTNDASGARGFLEDARAATEHVTPAAGRYWARIGVANVGAHEVSVALELEEDPHAALVLAGRVDVSELQTPARRAGFCIYPARAHSLRGNDDAMVIALREATRHSLQTVRYSVQARELVQVGLRRQKPCRVPGLNELAEELSVAV